MTVYLVGAGPGDPGLLTVRGAEVLRRADVVVHDRLAEPSLLDLAPAGAERIDVGKSPGAPIPQDRINALLVERGRAGQEVVRLKGGDPFVFGRGGEEAEALGAAGVPFEVVPGVTSAVAVPAYAGVPVTHRGLSTSFTVVTGHRRHATDDPVDWDAVARAGGTIVVLMGVAHRAELAGDLIAGGLPARTPVAAVRWGTRPGQRTVRTTLDRLHQVELEPPVTLVIGKVAALDLAWFETRPLFGRRVVVTRAREQASALADRLRTLGAEVVHLPTIEIADPADGGAALAAAAARVRHYGWVAFTSANAVERFFACLRDARALGDTRVAAVGPATADSLAARGVVADLVPRRSVASALAEAFPHGSGRVLLPQAAIADDALSSGLGAKGWSVDVVEAYRTLPVVPPPEVAAAAAKADAVAFTSSSTVDNYVDAVGAGEVPPVVACIGPATAATARRRGLDVSVVADEQSVDGLAAAIASWFSGGGGDQRS
ncbi:MAG TPA: uroporphyrinogen-III C-methyltransferase [Acidimicrobiales bacterium]|nr:uroporphyrinogen-III C-methyltransferase [Acidimicrobiales bacterium]